MKTVYILHGKNGSHCGVYSSLKQLRKGVDYWLELYPNDTMSYIECDVNYIQEPNCWGWAFISPKAELAKLAAGGSEFIPNKTMWGKNLIGLNLKDEDYVPVKRLNSLYNKRVSKKISEDEKRQQILKDMKKMSADEIFDLAVRTGIYTKNGKLTKQYGGTE